MPDRYVLVLAGGRGERFWPWSRPERPKQLLPLARDGRSLLGATFDRIAGLVPPDHCLVITGRDLVEAVRRECPAGVEVIGEPQGRNTAPAIAAAAHRFRALNPGAAFAVLPSDHAIDDTRAFARDLTRAFEVAERTEVLLTFGIPPTGPAVSFGYLARGANVGDRLFRVAAFIEKPDLGRAKAFVEGGEHAWNSGMFVWRASTFLDALEAGRPALADTLRPLAAAGPRFEAVFAEALRDCESISVDYAVLEKAPNVMMIEASFDWDDLGSWGAWARRQPRDARGNVVFGEALAMDCDRCVVVGEGGTAAALGLADMVVVHVNGATLSCRLDRSEEVRQVAEAARAMEAAR